MEESRVVTCLPPCPACVARVGGAWLAEFSWDLFATLTFATYVPSFTADRRWRDWIMWLRCYAQGPVRWARALEYQKRGVIHYHALLQVHFRRGHYHEGRFYVRYSLVEIKDAWERIGHGFARVEKFDPGRGGGRYLAKYVAKGGELDLGGFWPGGLAGTAGHI